MSFAVGEHADFTRNVASYVFYGGIDNRDVAWNV